MIITRLVSEMPISARGRELSNAWINRPMKERLYGSCGGKTLVRALECRENPRRAPGEPPALRTFHFRAYYPIAPEALMASISSGLLFSSSASAQSLCSPSSGACWYDFTRWFRVLIGIG